MSTTAKPVKPQAAPVWEAPETKPLDEAVWKAWVAKGRAEDRRSRTALLKAAAWGLLVAAVAGAAVAYHLKA